MSNKKQFEYIENRIKQAADSGQLNYGPPPWDKMEALLDKKEKRRRPLLWYCILALIIAGGWGIYTLLPANTERPVSSNRSAVPDKAATSSTSVDEPSIDGAAAPASAAPDHADARKGNVSPMTTAQTTSGKKAARSIQRYGSATPVTGRNHKGIVAGAHKKTLPPAEKDGLQVGQETTAVDIASAVDRSGGPVQPAITPDSLAKQAPATKDTLKQEQIMAVKVPVKNKRPNPSKGFYFLGSVGADISGVDPFSYENSTVKVRYGGGVGFQFSRKFSVQTGLYISDKKYSAGPDDYHPKEGSYWERAEIKKVDAVCRVYEIPLTVRYDFLQKPTTAYYATVSASSYIMQREDYDYHYTWYGNYYESSWEYTGNRHLFSTLVLSAGIEKKLSGRFSLLAEPSFSIPLTGVGDGSVKLFSTALMIGLKYKPFCGH